MIKKKVYCLFVAVLIAFSNFAALLDAGEFSHEEVTEYTGMCDASAAVAITASTFVVANDEDNILRFYRHDGRDRGPIQTFYLGPFLNLDAKHPEADIEAAAQIGNRIYWMTSHARNRKAKRRASRHQFFATEVENIAGRIVVTFVGQAYNALLDDMIHAPSLHRFALQEASRLAAKHEGSLNIEGLSAKPDGSLWIAFRSPVPDGKALLVTLSNPEAVIDGESAIFGDVIQLALHGLGIRAMEYLDQMHAYIIVAGASGSGNEFKLFLWSGLASDDPLLIESVNLQGLHPEAVIAYPIDGTAIQLLSDDGKQHVAGTRCKDAAIAERRFRSVWIRTK